MRLLATGLMFASLGRIHTSTIISVFILIWLCFSASCQGNSGIPEFSWLRVQPQPLLKITFPDGFEDTAVLKRFNPIPAGPNERAEDVDPCIFDGYLSHEDDVYVTVTGCPSSGNFDVKL